MRSMNEHALDALAYVRKNWIILAALVAGGVAWGTNTAQLAAAGEQADGNSDKITTLEEKLGSIDRKLTEELNDLSRAQAEQAVTSRAQQRSIDRIDRNLEALVEALREQQE